MNYTFTGYQIPQAIVKRVGNKIYLLYLLPLSAIFCCGLNILGNRRRYFDLIAALIGLTLSLALLKQAMFFNQNKLLVDIKEQWGFRASIYLFLALGILSLLKAIIHRHQESTPSRRSEEKQSQKYF